MSSDAQLAEWARENVDAPGESQFVGVFMSDEVHMAENALWQSRARFKSVIFNYDPRGKAGTHWVAARFERSGPGEWFDSYGTPPDWDDKILHDNTHFRDFMKRMSTRGVFSANTIDLQAIETNVCGHYALWFCKHGMPDRKNKAWRALLAEADRKKRDAMIRELVKLTPS